MRQTAVKNEVCSLNPDQILVTRSFYFIVRQLKFCNHFQKKISYLTKSLHCFHVTGDRPRVDDLGTKLLRSVVVLLKKLGDVHGYQTQSTAFLIYIHPYHHLSNSHASDTLSALCPSWLIPKLFLFPHFTEQHIF